VRLEHRLILMGRHAIDHLEIMHGYWSTSIYLSVPMMRFLLNVKDTLLKWKYNTRDAPFSVTTVLRLGIMSQHANGCTKKLLMMPMTAVKSRWLMRFPQRLLLYEKSGCRGGMPVPLPPRQSRPLQIYQIRRHKFQQMLLLMYMTVLLLIHSVSHCTTLQIKSLEVG